MKTYTVRLEFNVISTDFAEINITANSEAEARKLAKDKYFNEEVDLVYWASSYVDTTLDVDSIKDWLVEESE